METGEIWLVTGANGFLGFNVPHVMKSENLIALTRSGELPPGYSAALQVDLTHISELREAIMKINPDYIVHAAALASHEECARNSELAYAVNADATRAIAEIAREIGSKMIYISTDAVFNGQRGDYSELDVPDPFSVYGASKLAGEYAIKDVDPTSLIIRTNFFGWSPNHTRSILEFFVNNLEAKNPINGYSDFTVSSIYVRYLLEHIQQLKNESGVWHVTSRDSLTKYEFGCQVADVFGLSSDLISPVTGQGEVSRSRDISLNTDKFQGFLSNILAPGLSSQHEGIARAHKDRPAATLSV